VIKIIDSINSHPQNAWDYYANIIPESFLQNPFSNQNISHKDFIKKYFHRSGKEEVLNNKHFDVEDSLLEFASHTNSIFFLGSMIYHNSKIKEILFPKQKNPAGYEVFPFLWFLTCLFHDLGYEYEKRSSQHIKAIFDLDGLKQEFKLTRDFRDQKLKGVYMPLLDCVARYFILRRYRDKKIDHGILAGFFLYDRLVKNRKKKFKSDKSLFWGKRLEKQYAIAASTIACHNIWVNQLDQKESYNSFDLSQLTAFQPMTASDYPFLYLLGIVDTMDPVKAFKNDGSAEEILTDIMIEIKDDSVSFSKRMGSVLDFKKLIAKTNYLRGWLAIEIRTEENLIELKFQWK
jgi:hypothetical protein